MGNCTFTKIAGESPRLQLWDEYMLQPQTLGEVTNQLPKNLNTSKTTNYYENDRN